MKTLKLLIVATSHAQMGDTMRKTGLWLEALASPYYIFKEAGATVTLASVRGGAIPVDPKSESIIVATSNTKRFLKDPQAASELLHSLPVETLQAADFDGILLAGGHGAMWDFADNSPLKELLEGFIRAHKMIGALDHGVAGLLPLKNELGEAFVKGRFLTAFSTSEEDSSGLSTIVPFLLESRLADLGAIYNKGPVYTSHVVIDGNLITGQNPGSSLELTRKMLASMKQAAEEASYVF
jgi:putative intracellular protease/amidase